MELPSLEKIKARPKIGQAHRHQEEGTRTAELLNDMRHLSFYVKLFKEHPFNYPELIACREWVLKTKAEKEGTDDPVRSMGALFTKTYRDFLNPKQFKPRP